MRTSEITKRPVVTLTGEDVAQIKDVIYSAGGGAVGGFTLAGRGMFAGPMDVALSWSSVTALGTDAVMITSGEVLEPVQGVLSQSASSGGSGGDVLGSRVLTDDGSDLGEVVDVIVEVTNQGPCTVIGYEIEPSDASGTKGATVLIPLPDTVAASGQNLIVPASARDFVGHDLAGFGAAVKDFRAQLGGRD